MKKIMLGLLLLSSISSQAGVISYAKKNPGKATLIAYAAASAASLFFLPQLDEWVKQEGCNATVEAAKKISVVFLTLPAGSIFVLAANCYGRLLP